MTLEEREREEFVKLKHIKRVLEKRKMEEVEKVELKV
jgi:vacuolar-type H+-ATPase subunit D/Vma8